MKLLASDYDRTLYTNEKNLMLNMKAIKKFRLYCNKFVLVTGRSFKSIKKEIEYYNIKYDYLACNNGLIVFDDKDNIIDSSLLVQADLNYIYELLNGNKDVKRFEFYGVNDCVYELNNILEVYVKFKNIKILKQYKKYIETGRAGIRCFTIGNKMFISNNRTKADAVEFIRNLDDIDIDDVYTVGDSVNDLEMLERYNGHKMLFSHPKLLLKDIPVTKEVHQLIKKINNKNRFKEY